MRKERKPTRRAILIRLLNGMLRKYIEAKIAAAKAEYGKSEYDMAMWQQTHYGGEFDGALEAAFALGIISWEERNRLERRETRVRAAANQRCKKLRAAKYSSEPS